MTPRLTEAQEGLWYAQRLDPDNPVFNTAQYIEIRGPLDVEAFRAAVQQAMAEADALAIRIVDAPDGPRQEVDERLRAALQVIDLSRDAAPKDAARAWMRADLDTAIDPAVGPLAAQALLVLAPGHCLWYQRVHHLVIDGYGTALLTARICDLYSARVANRPPATMAFADWTTVLAADEEYRASNRREADRAFWAAELSGATGAGLSAGVALSARSYISQDLDLPPAAGAALRALAERADVPWPDLVAALAAAYVGRHGVGSDVTIGLAAMVRLGTPAARVPAMVMNVLPLRVAVDEEAPLDDWLRDVANRARRARTRGRYRSEQVRRDLGLLGGERRLHGPLVNVLPFDEAPVLHGLTTRLEVLATGPVDDLTIIVRGTPELDRLQIQLDANPRLYDPEDLAAHAARLAAFIANAAAADRLADVPTLTSDEREQWAACVNATAHPVEDTTLDALIQRTVARTPEAPALVYGDRVLSYADLDAAVRRLADALRRHGVGRGDIVAVALPRSIELVLTLLAAMRAGAAYLPLDLEHPTARRARILRAAVPKLVVTTGAGRGDSVPDVPAIDVDEALRASADGSAVRSPGSPGAFDAPRPGDAAYVIYTSGSTGEPKGVVIEHRAIVNRLEWMRQAYDVGPADRILQKTPATFDVSVWEFFLPLIAGATLVVAPPDAHRDPREIARLFASQRISIAHFVPSMLAEFLAEPLAAATPVRAVFCSGEALPAALRDRFHAVLHAELHNLYGPTEAAVDVTAWSASAMDRSDPVPIGRPVWNTRTYVLDERRRPVPPGVPGHLYLAGVQLAREYLGRPDLTAERFVPDPFAGPGERMYLTGDLARWRSDGAIEFLGRTDHQVKIRGQRIELGEIEAAIAATGLAARALVIADRHAGDTRLVAYVEPAGAAIDESALRAALASRLPDAMLPAAIVPVTTWPTTANGKLDRARLPEAPRGAAPGRGPATPTEARLVRLVAEVLALEPETIAADADFFALGGHSLAAVRLVRRLRDEWGCDVPLGAVFAHPTLAALAAFVDGLSGGTAGDESRVAGLQCLLPLRVGGEARAPLVCVHPAGGLAWCYGHLARALTPERPVFGLQARGLQPGAPLPASLSALAADYVAELRRVQPSGPYHLAGWSIGGIIAHEMAVQLEAAGERVGLLAMLDAYPSDRWRGAADPDEAAALRALLLMAGEQPNGDGARLTRAEVVSTLRRGGHPLGQLSDEVLAGVLRVVAHNNRLVRRHHHERAAARLLHFRATLEHLDDGVSAEEWRPYVGGLETIEIAALHAHMTGAEASRLVAAALTDRMDV